MNPIHRCPFCDYDNCVVKESKGSGFYYVYCICCDARGPECSTETRAIMNWNKAKRSE